MSKLILLKKNKKQAEDDKKPPKPNIKDGTKKSFEKIFHNFHGKTKAPNERAGILRARGGINLVISSTAPLCKNLVKKIIVSKHMRGEKKFKIKMNEKPRVL